MNDAIQISLALADEGHKVTVVTSDYGENYDRHRVQGLLGTDIRVYHQRAVLFRSPWSNVRVPLYALPCIDYSAFDVIHFYNLFSTAHLQSIMISKLSNARVVARTEADSPDVWRSLSRPVIRALVPRFSKKIGAVTTFTEKGMNRLKSLSIPDSKLFVVPPLLDRRPFQRIAKERPKSFSVGMIGSISAVKGWDLIVDPLVKYFSSHKEDQLLLAGTIEDKSYAEAILAKLTKLTNFNYLGPVFPSWHFYPKVNVVIFPSRREGGPKAVLEALSSSRIVICSDISPYNEWIKHGENGFIARSPEEFITYLEVAKQDSGRISGNAFNSTEQFDASHAVKLLDRIYRPSCEG